MLIYREARISDVTRGDLVAIEVPGIYITGTVTSTNPANGTLSFVPLTCAKQPEGGAGFGILGLYHPAGANAITLDMSGATLSKAVDSEAAVTYPLTWQRIVELEPRVGVLLTGIQAECPTEWTWLRIWYGYKERLSEFVGWDREAAAYPELRSSAAYDIVYNKLLDCLTDLIPTAKSDRSESTCESASAVNEPMT
jgi:hypothetical protein